VRREGREEGRGGQAAAGRTKINSFYNTYACIYTEA
jgi:hypothetical protein